MRRDPAFEIFRLFGVTLRLVVFQRISRHPQTAGELAKELPIGRPAVVQHLTALKAAGLVEARRDGRRRVYAPSKDGLRPLSNWLQRHGGR